jgi:hypothetical protein
MGIWFRTPLVFVLLLAPACAPVPSDFVPEDRGDREPDWSELPPPPDPFDLGGAMADARLISEMAYDYLGCSVASAGDVDGDGYDDVVVGAYGSVLGGGVADQLSTSAGAAYLLLGPLQGEVEVSAAHARFIGEGEDNLAGIVVAGAGDLDGDGLDEVVVGAPVDGDIEAHGGRAYVLGFADAGDVDLGTHSPSATGEHDTGSAGWDVAPGGDVDGDGVGDLLIGDLADDTRGFTHGAAYLVLGPVVADLGLADAEAKFTGEHENDCAGIALAAAGDLDADGYGDFLVGAPNLGGSGESTGWAYIVHGPVSGGHGLDEADTILEGEAPGDQAGYSVAGGGDVDGDGRLDVVVGARYAESRAGESTGIVYVVLAPDLGRHSLAEASTRIVTDEVGANIGTSVDLAGDVDGNGAIDVLIGGWVATWLLTDLDAGEVFLDEVGLRLELPDANVFDHTVAGGGDVNGDGVDDFWIGVQRDSTDHYLGGSAYLFYGGERFR